MIWKILIKALSIDGGCHQDLFWLGWRGKLNGRSGALLLSLREFRISSSYVVHMDVLHFLMNHCLLNNWWIGVPTLDRVSYCCWNLFLGRFDPADRLLRMWFPVFGWILDVSNRSNWIRNTFEVEVASEWPLGSSVIPSGRWPLERVQISGGSSAMYSSLYLVTVGPFSENCGLVVDEFSCPEHRITGERGLFGWKTIPVRFPVKETSSCWNLGLLIFGIPECECSLRVWVRTCSAHATSAHPIRTFDWESRRWALSCLLPLPPSWKCRRYSLTAPTGPAYSDSQILISTPSSQPIKNTNSSFHLEISRYLFISFW